MRCLVTGASGHLGSHLTRLLLDRGHSVTALVRPSSDLWRLEGISGRITLVRNMHEIPADACETIFHLAWAGVTAASRDLPENIVANVITTLQLFEIARAAGCQCWIGIGSQAEYGPQNGVLKENFSPDPRTPYGVAKLCLGNLLAALCQQADIRFVWLRLTAAYGPMDDATHLIPTVINALLSGQCPLLTNGKQQWDYLYVEDAANAIYQTSLMREVQGTFNLAAGCAPTVRSIVERIRDMVDPSLPVQFGDRSVESLRADSQKLREATGWRPETNLESGLSKTLGWYESIRLHR